MFLSASWGQLRQRMRDRLASHGVVLAGVALGLVILGAALPFALGAIGTGLAFFLFPIAAALSLLGLVYSVIGLWSSRRLLATLGIVLCIIAAAPAGLVSLQFIRNLLAVEQVAAFADSPVARLA